MDMREVNRCHVLLVEKVENLLRKRNRKLRGDANSTKLSLYDNTASDIIDNMKKAGTNNQETAVITSLCKVLEVRALNVSDFLDIKGDLEWEEGRHSYRFDELYSDEMLLRKVYRIVELSQKAIQTIVKEKIPVLTSSKSNLQMIGSVYRNQQDSGIQYIMVKRDEGEYCSPIIELKDKRANTYPDYDEFFVNHLQKIHRTQDDIMNSGSAALWCCFDEEVFYNIIYGHVKKCLKRY